MTKKLWTYSEVKEKIQSEMDTQEETFVDDSEYLDYTNEAIDECEAEIHSLYQDYFITSALIAIVAGEETSDLPADIYANKIRHFQFKSANKKYEIKRIKNKDKKFVEDSSSNPVYRYDIENSLAAGPKITWYPEPTVSDATSAKMYYIRNAKRVVELTDVIDIPEFIQFIFCYIRVKIARKETNPLLMDYKDELERQRILMREVLDEMIPDEDDNIDPDLSFYNDFDSGDDYGYY